MTLEEFKIVDDVDLQGGVFVKDNWQNCNKKEEAKCTGI
jgi:hypothetical protein